MFSYNKRSDRVDKKRRITTTVAIWSTPIVLTSSLPAHAEMTGACSSNIWSGDIETFNGELYTLRFDRNSGFWTAGSAPFSDTIIVLDYNANGIFLGQIGGTDWTVSGATAGDKILGIFDTSSNLSLTAIHQQTAAFYCIELTIDRFDPNATGAITYAVSISGMI